MLNHIDVSKHDILTRINDGSGMLMDVDIYRNEKGFTLEFNDSDKEIAILLLTGSINIISPVYETFSRQDIFTETPNVIHVSKDTKLSIKFNEKSEILVQKTYNDRTFDHVIYKTVSEIHASSEIFEGRDNRLIRTVFDYNNAPYSNMVLGEVISHQGSWSSYLPHHHRQPEVYYYRTDHKNGFGACFIGEDVFKITNESYSCITPNLVHPQSIAPGYKLYYTWMIRHLENDPWNERIFDEKHTHLVEGK